MVGTDSMVHTEADIDSDTNFVGKAQMGSALAPVRHESVHRSSLSRFLLSFPSGVDMLYNPSHDALLITKCTEKDFWGTYNLLQV